MKKRESVFGTLTRESIAKIFGKCKPLYPCRYHFQERSYHMQTRIGNLRWGIAVLLGIGIVINYLDRVNISVATAPLEHEFHLSQTEMGIILSSYLWSYALLQIPVGALLDRFGVKWLVRIMNFVNNLVGIAAPIVAGIIFDRT